MNILKMSIKKEKNAMQQKKDNDEKYNELFNECETLLNKNKQDIIKKRDEEELRYFEELRQINISLHLLEKQLPLLDAEKKKKFTGIREDLLKRRESLKEEQQKRILNQTSPDYEALLKFYDDKDYEKFVDTYNLPKKKN